jgi:hypothetical protein
MTKKKKNSNVQEEIKKYIRNDSETFETLIDDCRYRIPGERKKKSSIKIMIAARSR